MCKTQVLHICKSVLSKTTLCKTCKNPVRTWVLSQYFLNSFFKHTHKKSFRSRKKILDQKKFFKHTNKKWFWVQKKIFWTKKIFFKHYQKSHFGCRKKFLDLENFWTTKWFGSFTHFTILCLLQSLEFSKGKPPKSGKKFKLINIISLANQFQVAFVLWQYQRISH